VVALFGPEFRERPAEEAAATRNHSLHRSSRPIIRTPPVLDG
jgi:hypothetical protein